MSVKTYNLTSECHVIPHPDPGEKVLIAYFPLKSLALRVNRSGSDLIKRLKAGPVAAEGEDDRQFLDHLRGMGVVNGLPDRVPKSNPPPVPTPTRTMLLVSDRCNLHCVYCYREAENVGDLMPFEVAKAALDTIIENAFSIKKKFVNLTFHGGGEPTINWEVLTQATDYARKSGKDKNIKIITSICTNGVMSKKHATWLAKNIDKITVSIDGPPEVQNHQRPLFGGGPSFERVAKTLDTFKSLGKTYMFRTTATALTQSRLADIFKFLAKRFKPMTIHIEPLFVCGRCLTSDCEPPDAKAFADDIIRTMELSRKTRVRLFYSGGRLFYMDNVFCSVSGKNFLITPRGEVTACLEVSTVEDPRAEMFMYGRYNPATTSFDFDTRKYKELRKIRVENFGSCKDCFARWHCCGDCPAKAPDMAKMGSLRNEYRCQINKSVTLHQLIRELDRSDGGAQGGRKRTPASGVKSKV